MRYSKQREAVYQVLKNTHCHPDVSYIYNEVRKQMPSISLGTVYRNLSELCCCGRIKRLGLENSAERFDANMDNHAHFVCTSCGNVYDIDRPTAHIKCSCGDVQRTEVILYGSCNECVGSFSDKNKKGE